MRIRVGNVDGAFDETAFLRSLFDEGGAEMGDVKLVKVRRR